MADWFCQRGYNERTVYHEESGRDFGYRTDFYRDSTGYFGYRPDFICCSPELPSYDGTNWETTEEIEQRNSLQLAALEDRLQSIESKMDLLADDRAKFKKTFENGLAKVLKRLDALTEEQNGKEVTPKGELVPDEAANDNDIGGIEEAAIRTEEAETKDEETTEFLANVHAGGTREKEPVQVSNSEKFEKELDSDNEVQNKIETKTLMVSFENHNLLEETPPNVDLVGWINNAITLFDKMHEKHYYLGKATDIWVLKAMGGPTIVGRINGPRRYSVGANFVFDPGGRKFKFSLLSHLEDKVDVWGAANVTPRVS